MKLLLLSLVKEFIHLTTETIFPFFCISCKTRGSLLCANCTPKIKRVSTQRCLPCGAPSWHGLTHPKCKTNYTPDRLITAFFYQDKIVKNLINLAKYSLIVKPLRVLSKLANVKLKDHQQLSKFTACPIPSSVAKTKFRGFNPAHEVSKIISETNKIPIKELLQKKRFVQQQKSLNKIERFKNIAGAFSCSAHKVPDNILLVDDVTTSGATLLAATKVLKKAGAKTIWCLALAQD